MRFLLLFLFLAVPRAGIGQITQPEHPLDPEAATEAYLATVSEEARERSDAYFEGGYWLRLVGFLYGIGIAGILLASRLSSRMREWAERWTGRGFVGSALYVVQYAVVTFALGLPLTVYRGFLREHHYGLATQTFGAWFRDQLVALAVAIVLGAIAIAALYIAIRKAGPRWWLYGAGGGAVFMGFVLLIGPVYIAPLFNTYRPLDDPALEGPILTMARANGVPVDRVYQFDASRQSRRISANVSGFLETTRISLNDNLLERCSLSEIKAVMGHEVGHYALGHIREMILFNALLLAGGLAFVNASFEWVRRRWGDRFGVRDIGDIAGLPLLVALLSVYMFFLTPLTNSFSRVNEAEADIFGLNVAREPDGFATVALKLAEYRKLSPGPVEEILFYDHPSGRSRILMAMRWKAEQSSEGNDFSTNPPR